jgi:hypothetical protein
MLSEILCGFCQPLQANYSETSIHRFRRGSEKERMDPGKQQMREP